MYNDDLTAGTGCVCVYNVFLHDNFNFRIIGLHYIRMDKNFDYKLLTYKYNIRLYYACAIYYSFCRSPFDRVALQKSQLA